MYIWPGLMAMNHLLTYWFLVWTAGCGLVITSWKTHQVQRHSSQNWVRVLVCVCLGWISQQKHNVYFYVFLIIVWYSVSNCGICWPVFQFHLLICLISCVVARSPARKRRSSLLWKLWDAPAPSLQGARRCTCPTSLASPSTPRRTWKCTELLTADCGFFCHTN